MFVTRIGIIACRPGEVGPAHVDGAAGETGRMVKEGVVEKNGILGSVVFDPAGGGGRGSGGFKGVIMVVFDRPEVDESREGEEEEQGNSEEFKGNGFLKEMGKEEGGVEIGSDDEEVEELVIS